MATSRFEIGVRRSIHLAHAALANEKGGNFVLDQGESLA